MIYKVVEEWSSPTYIDHETGNVLYETTDAERQCYWVVTYDLNEHEIIEWVEQFPSVELAKDYIKKNEVEEEA